MGWFGCVAFVSALLCGGSAFGKGAFCKVVSGAVSGASAMFTGLSYLLSAPDAESIAQAMPPVSLRHLERTARLSYLEPAIVQAVLEGTQPRSLSARVASHRAV